MPEVLDPGAPIPIDDRTVNIDLPLDRSVFASPTIPANASASTSVVLLNLPQQGIMKHVWLIGTNLLGTAGEIVTISLQNTQGEVYFQTVLSLTASAVAGILWAFSQINRPFDRGLQLVVSTGATGGSNQGQLSLNVVWHA